MYAYQHIFHHLCLTVTFCSDTQTYSTKADSKTLRICWQSPIEAHYKAETRAPMFAHSKQKSKSCSHK